MRLTCTVFLCVALLQASPASPSPNNENLRIWLRLGGVAGPSDTSVIQPVKYPQLSGSEWAVAVGVQIRSIWRIGVGYQDKPAEGELLSGGDGGFSFLFAIIGRELLNSGHFGLHAEARVGRTRLAKLPYKLTDVPPNYLPQGDDVSLLLGGYLVGAWKPGPAWVELQVGVGYRHASFEVPTYSDDVTASGPTATLALVLSFSRRDTG